MARQRSAMQGLLWAALAVLIVAFGVGPLALMLVGALRDVSVLEVLGDARLWTMLGRTVSLSFLVTTLATLLGGVTGYCLGATSWRGKGLARIVLLLPLVIPPYFHAIAWTTFLRPDGVVAQFLSEHAAIPPTTLSESVYSFWGATVILALAYFPVAMLFCEKSLTLASPSLAEAARVFGANPWQIFRVARWPFIWPSLASSVMVIFLLSSAELGVPTLLKVRVFNFEVFTRLGAFNDVASATLLAFPLLVVGVLVVLWERYVIRSGFFEVDGQDVAFPVQATRVEAGINWGVFSCMAFLFVLPFCAVLADGWNAAAMTRVWALARQPALNTFFYGVSAALLITLIAFSLAWINRNATSRRIVWTDYLLMVGFALPGSILALALLSLYDRPGVLLWVTPICLVVVALVVRYLIVGYRIVATAMGHIPGELIEAAELDGAGSLGTLWHVVIPLTKVALLASLAVAFVLAAGEIGTTILLYPPGGETLPIALYSIEANSPHAYVSAMTILQLLFLAIPLGVVTLLLRFIPE